VATWSAWIVCSAGIAIWLGAPYLEPRTALADAPSPINADAAVESPAEPAAGDAELAALKSELEASRSLVNDLRAALEDSPRANALPEDSGMSAGGIVALTLFAVAGLSLTAWSLRSMLLERWSRSRPRRGTEPHLQSAMNAGRQATCAYREMDEPLDEADPAVDATGLAAAAYHAERQRRASIAARRRARALCVQTGPLAEQARLLRESVISRENVSSACFALGRVPTFVAHQKDTDGSTDGVPSIASASESDTSPVEKERVTAAEPTGDSSTLSARDAADATSTGEAINGHRATTCEANAVSPPASDAPIEPVTDHVAMASGESPGSAAARRQSSKAA
jgi:hypothetical protein